MKTRRIILAGGSGFLGQILREHFLKQGCEAIVLTRCPGESNDKSREVSWDGHSVGEWAHELDGADVLINLAGRSVDCRYHARNRKLMMDSRVDSTRVLGEAVARCANPPRVWLNSSTATIYRHNFGPAWNEDGEIGATPEAQDAFSIEIATAWEREFNAALSDSGSPSTRSSRREEAHSSNSAHGTPNEELNQSLLTSAATISQTRSRTPRTRNIALRSAMVFGHGANSVFPVLCRLARFGLGGRMASGRQYVSWIHGTDFCHALAWLIDHEEFTGPVNLAAPNPVTNAEMMATVRKLCGVPFGLPATAWMLEVGAFFLRTETELIIKSRRVAPAKLVASGFKFQFPELRAALESLNEHSPR